MAQSLCGGGCRHYFCPLFHPRVANSLARRSCSTGDFHWSIHSHQTYNNNNNISFNTNKKESIRVFVNHNYYYHHTNIIPQENKKEISKKDVETSIIEFEEGTTLQEIRDFFGVRCGGLALKDTRVVLRQNKNGFEVGDYELVLPPTHNTSLGQKVSQQRNSSNATATKTSSGTSDISMTSHTMPNNDELDTEDLSLRASSLNQHRQWEISNEILSDERELFPWLFDEKYQPDPKLI